MDAKGNGAQVQGLDAETDATEAANTPASQVATHAIWGTGSPATPSGSLTPQQRSVALRNAVMAEVVRVAQDPAALMCEDEMKGLPDVV